MELRQFRYFVALAEELHFRRAAERLRISQPPLTVQIQALEREVGARLFDRGQGGVHLTGPGRVFLSHAREVIASVETAKKNVRLASEAKIGELRLGMTISAEFLPFLPRAIHSYRRGYPEVILHLEEMTSAIQVKAVEEGKLDLGLVRKPENKISDTLELTFLWRDTLVLGVHESNPLAAETSIDMRMLVDELFITYPRDPGIGMNYKLMELCAGAGFKPRIIQEGRGSSMILGLVAAGLGVALMPHSLHSLNIEGVRFIPIAAPSAECDLYVVSRASDKNPLLRELLRTLKSFASDTSTSRKGDGKPLPASRNSSMRATRRSIKHPPMIP